MKQKAEDPGTVNNAQQLYQLHFTSVDLSRTMQQITQLSDNLNTVIDQSTQLIDPIVSTKIPNMIPPMDQIIADLVTTKVHGVSGCNAAKFLLKSWKNAIKPYSDGLKNVGINI